jgi:hypothetical protein
VKSIINRYYDPTTGSFVSVDPNVIETGQPFSYSNDDPVNATDPLGLGWGWNPISDITEVSHDAVTEVTSHWRGLAKIGLAAVVVVGGSACVLATAGICGAAAFPIGGVEVSGGAIALGFVAGTAEGAADYALDCGQHTLGGYLSGAAKGGLLDAVFAGIPEEAVFGDAGAGAHAYPLNYFEALQYIPKYLYSVIKWL